VIVHTYLSADAPAPYRAVALITTPTGKSGAELHPVIFRAPDEAAARANAEAWWASELDRLGARKAPKGRRPAAPKEADYGEAADYGEGPDYGE
jgi:hypothetical protein